MLSERNFYLSHNPLDSANGFYPTTLFCKDPPSNSMYLAQDTPTSSQKLCPDTEELTQKSKKTSLNHFSFPQGPQRLSKNPSRT